MSTKKSRFAELAVVKQVSALAEGAPTPVQGKREPMTTLLRPELRVALKQASAQEKRKVYQVVEDSLVDYLKRHHPNLLK